MKKLIKIYKLNFLFYAILLNWGIVYGQQQNVCINEIKNYWVDRSENGGEGTTGSTYSWQITTTGFSDGINSTTTSGNQIQIQWTNSPVGSYTLEVIESSAESCTTPQILNINVFENPISTLLPNYQDCTEVTLDAGFNSDYQYNWTVPNGVDNPGNVSNFTTSVSGNYSVTIANSGVCTESFNTVVEIFEKPVIQDIITNGVNVTVVATGGLEPLEYSVDGGITWSQNPNFVLSSGLVFTAMVRNSEGCTVQRSAMIDFVVQNTITPNNDGKNDYFEIRGLDAFPNAQFSVFDRYGKKIFDSKEENSFRWNGHYLGRPLPTTSYWYILDLGDGTEVFKGWIFVKNANQ